jgi:hypothetical protein
MLLAGGDLGPAQRASQRVLLGDEVTDPGLDVAVLAHARNYATWTRDPTVAASVVRRA